MRYAPLFIGLTCVLALSSSSFAGPISADVTITGGIGFDPTNPFADATSTGTFGLVVGGVPSESQYAAGTVIVGSSALRRTCLETTTRLGSPFRVAVRT